MKSIFATVLLLSFALGFSQNKTTVKKVTNETSVEAPVKVSSNKESMNLKGDAEVIVQKEISDYSQIFEHVEMPAKPILGMDAFRKSVMSSFRMPEVDEDVLAKVTARFVIWDDGSLRDIQIIKEEPRGLGLGKEFIRILSKSEKWNPAQINEKNVKQYYTLPISLQLKEEYEIEKSIEEVRKEEAPIIVENNSTLSEKQAQPTGGIKKFYTDLSSKIQVPEVEVPGNYKTKVKFLVNQDGSLSDFLVMEETPQNVGLGLNVIKYLQSYGNWMPGEQNGKKVKTYFILPVTLNIEPEIESNTNKKN